MSITSDFTWPDYHIFYCGVLLPKAAYHLPFAYSVLTDDLDGSEFDSTWEWFIKIRTCFLRSRSCPAQEAINKIASFNSLLKERKNLLLRHWLESSGSKDLASYLVELTFITVERMSWATPRSGQASWIGLELTHFDLENSLRRPLKLEVENPDINPHTKRHSMKQSSTTKENLIFYGGILLPDGIPQFVSACQPAGAKLSARPPNEALKWLSQLCSPSDHERTSLAKDSQSFIHELKEFFNSNKEYFFHHWKKNFNDEHASYYSSSIEMCFERMLWATPRSKDVSWVNFS